MPKKQTREEPERESLRLERQIVFPSNGTSKRTKSELFSRDLSALPVMACLINREGDLTQVSDAWLKKMSYEKTEVIGRRATDFLTEESKMRGETTLTECFEKQRIENVQVQFASKDGAIIDVLLSATALKGSSETFESSIITMTDVTELKRIERELIESGKKYRDLFEKGSDLLCIHDFAGNLLETNLSYKKKYATENEDLKGVNIKKFIPDRYKAEFDQYLERIKQKGEEEGSLRVITKNGDEAILEYSNKLMYDDEGRPVAVQGTARDVTKRLMAERALRETKRSIEQERNLLQEVINGAKNIHLVYLDRDFNFIRVNQAYAATCGYQPKEMIGKNHFALYPHPENEAIFRRVRDTGIPFEIRDKSFIFPDQPGRGLTYWDWSLTPIKRKDGTTSGLVYSLVETTKRKEAEEALKKSEQRFTLALKATQDAVWDWDLLTNSFYYSPQWWKQIGYEENELKADPDLWRRRLHPDDLDRAGRAVEKAIHNGTSFKVENRLLHKNGHYVPILTRGYILRDEHGRAVRISGANTDLTERKHLEAKIRRAHQELEIKVQERTSELAKSNEALKEYTEKLEKLNAELGDFIFVASHDLQEPLRKIQTFCDLVMGRCGSLLDAESKGYLNLVLNSVTRMRRHLQDLVRYKLLTAKPEKMQLTDLSRAVRMAADVLKDDFEICEGVLETDNLCVIEADEDQMVQLFQNLIGNALKFRGKKIPRIRISARMEGQECEIRIEDNGIGFDAQYSERIFRPFQKLHRQKEYEGSGMGLAICRKIVEWHGGKIWSESEPERGATFIIRLPAKHRV